MHLALVREYYEIIEAPDKELVVIDHSAHLPFLAETAEFTDDVIRVAEKSFRQGQRH
jgi:hypothetical protein